MQFSGCFKDLICDHGQLSLVKLPLEAGPVSLCRVDGRHPSCYEAQIAAWDAHALHRWHLFSAICNAFPGNS
jgi:hypothetical protein